METKTYTTTELQIMFLNDAIAYDDLFYSAYDSRVKMKLGYDKNCNRVLVKETPDGLYCTKEEIIKLKNYTDDGYTWIKKIQ